MNLSFCECRNFFFFATFAFFLLPLFHPSSMTRKTVRVTSCRHYSSSTSTTTTIATRHYSYSCHNPPFTFTFTFFTKHHCQKGKKKPSFLGEKTKQIYEIVFPSQSQSYPPAHVVGRANFVSMTINLGVIRGRRYDSKT